MIPEKNRVQIKGVRDGLLVTLGEGSWQDLEGTLLAQIAENEGFYKGARLALEVGNLILHAAELGSLRDKLSDRGISLWAVLSNSPTTEQTAQVLGLATRIFTPRPERTIKPGAQGADGDSAVLYRRTLRSGMRIVYQGNVVVLGDVNPGAEIIASGSVIVWGRLRGLVHAGAEGDQKAFVCALELNPMQLRIADLIAVTPRHRGNTQPEIAQIHNGRVIAETWVNHGGGK